MKTLLITLALVLLLTTAAGATQTKCYSWEDGTGTIMGYNGANLKQPSNVTGPQAGWAGITVPYSCPGAYHGTHYLHVAEDPHTGTPQAYVAYVQNLVNGDVVTASFFGYDTSAGQGTTVTFPSLRIWAHYALNDSITSYNGSAIPSTPNPLYTSGSPAGWCITQWTINFGTDGSPTGNPQALVIEARLYSVPVTSDPNHTDYWIDYVRVSAPDHATITFPGPSDPATAVENSTWGRIKSLFR